MSPKILKNLDELSKEKDSILKERSMFSNCVTISSGTCSLAKGSAELIETMKAARKKLRLENSVLLRSTGCHGFCDIEPIVHIAPNDVFYPRVRAENAEEILSEAITKNNVLDHLLYKDHATGNTVKRLQETRFYKGQRRMLMSMNTMVDPTSLDDYIAVGGYEMLAKALLTMSSEDVVSEIKKSGLRGRGGAGFPTGFKWEFCKKAKGDPKYIICNADEGDPGAYMDRSLLEGNPHCILEGMIIGAYAIGAAEGIVYVRNEYPMAVNNVRNAVKQLKERGLLGKKILGSQFDFDIYVERGAGAFVCGEETALIASIEGKIGEPRQRPPFPATKGLWGKPTNINNVETWANIPLILRRGASWYLQLGTEKSKGTKIFSLVGKVNNTGLVEVPMGTTLKEIIYDIGGGIKDGGKFKAVQTGGPSGGCIPEKHLDIPVDYESLAKVGSIMGSGGMIVMDNRTCMVDIAKYFLNFLREESCGKCLTCREGTFRMWEIVNDICEGNGKMEDLDLLEELAVVVKDASMCGLGQTAANPVLNTLRYFRHEYEVHIKDKKCPAGVCKKLINYVVDAKKCVGCLLCLKACPQKAIVGELKKPHIINPEECVRCGICMTVCKPKAILVV
ncbi:NADH-quinone oxidoreductase subunit NuoF [Elusimicrobiota bacterium]